MDFGLYECSPERAVIAGLNEHRPDVAAAELERSFHTERGDLLLHSGAQQLHVELHAEHELEHHHSERNEPHALHILHNCCECHHRLWRRVHRFVVGRAEREHRSEQYAFLAV